MNNSESTGSPTMPFLKRAKGKITQLTQYSYGLFNSHNVILQKLKKATRKTSLSPEQEKRLNHFISFIDGAENVDILENLCYMKTSKKHDIVGLLEVLEKAELEEKIGPQCVMDSILLFYHAPRQAKLSREEKSACRKLKNILIKRIPKLEKMLPKTPKS